ncbi:hypothetical protein BU26DRAFT_439633 [Trematosphaeria pertusa]|uniref:Mediator of RNA polymerase II transcription subunit 11 n=1 Tax=Trematosphaeria pertusa TaxID=390896 RepID=A0A6A6HUY6_9PLEO|nr:uncharacterized protein BU26DRAFT_439633 [Trematosphaeria pertusa]KAF2241994.1 hypothetical protein BU26DRAFT_439633 [Trematosphaeria pertusa]
MASTNPSAPTQPQSQSQNQQQQQQPYRDIAATQIRSLSAINARIPSILTTSATTISQLTNAPIHPPSMDLSPTAPDTPALRRAALSTSSNAFFSLVLELRTALHAQINELEEQGVIPAEAVRYFAPVQQQGPPGQTQQQAEHRDSEATVTNGGLGDFDVGVLNARAGVRQRDGEEVLGRVKKVLEELVRQSEEVEVKEEEMSVDG